MVLMFMMQIPCSAQTYGGGLVSIRVRKITPKDRTLELLHPKPARPYQDTINPAYHTSEELIPYV